MRRKLFWTVLFLLYLAVVLRITVFRFGFGTHPLWSGRINWNLMISYLPLIESKNWSRILYLFGGNIIWFLPFGIYLRVIAGWEDLWKITLAGLCFSFGIEFLQYVFGTGVSELDDLLLNTFGTWAGAFLSHLLKKRKEKEA